MYNIVSPPPPKMTESSPALAAIIAAIAKSDGWISFDRYLEIALHDPRNGFYGSGKVQFGINGDFITAPDISPLFAQMLAAQISQILPHTAGDILELGAGNGKLSASLAKILHKKIRRHYILETSAALRQKQQQTLHSESPIWLESLPKSFDGIIFGNEVLDAIPFRLYAKNNGKWQVRGVTTQNGKLQWQNRPPAAADAEIIRRLQQINPPDNYLTEANPRAEALTKTLCEILTRGALIFADYGFARNEFYHPQRNGGTLMCHHAQKSDSAPLESPGNKDITAHLDFTAIAEAGTAGGASLAGYTTQSHFLINCGIAATLQKKFAECNTAEYAKLASGAQKLLSPHEMGELFKLIAFVKGTLPPLLGFTQGNHRIRL